MLGVAALLRSNLIANRFRAAQPVGFSYNTYAFEPTVENQDELSITQITQPHEADEIIPMSITFSHSGPLNLRDLYFAIAVGHDVILAIPISILQATGTTTTYEGETMIRFKFDTFLESLPMVRFNNTDSVRYILSRSDGPISDTGIQAAHITVGLKFMDTAERREFATRNRVEKYMQSIHPLHVAVQDNIAEVVDFSRARYCKGFVVEGCDMTALTECTVAIIDRITETHGRHALRTIIERLGPNLFYIPFNAAVPFAENNARSFLGSMDYTSITPPTHTKLKLTFGNALDDTIRIYSVTVDMLISIPRVVYTLSSLHGGPVPSAQQQPQITWSNGGSRPITEGDRMMCPITYDDIGRNKTYTTCTTCTHNFDYDAFVDYLRTTAVGSKCPMCRTNWTNYVYYKNTVAAAPTSCYLS